MPQGFDVTDEAELHNAPRLLPSEICKTLLSWWLVANEGNPRTPNWDIASTCSIGGKEGLLLVEAKAHDKELIDEETGRKNIAPPVSIAARRNHQRIGWCIQDANLALCGETQLSWALSRDWNYQMCNRFAWCWKVAESGLPVILVYLGFLNAGDMADGTRKPLADAEEWQKLVESHSKPLFSKEVWNRKWELHGQSFIPLIRTAQQDLPSHG
jgi:hypothetical protein